MKLSSRLSYSTLAATLAAFPMSILAQVYKGDGVEAGVEAAAGLGLATGDPFDVILAVLRVILNLVALIAVFAIIIAGIYMIISLGNDERIEKAKKIIKYTLIGLIVILFARILVGLVTVILYSYVR